MANGEEGKEEGGQWRMANVGFRMAFGVASSLHIYLEFCTTTPVLKTHT